MGEIRYAHLTVSHPVPVWDRPIGCFCFCCVFSLIDDMHEATSVRIAPFLARVVLVLGAS